MHLRVGVPRSLLGLEPTSGHGKVWHRVLALLQEHVRITPLEQSGLRRRRLDVVLANGHDDLPLVSVPLVVQVHECGWFSAEQRVLIDAEFLDYIAPRTERAVRSANRVITPSEAARRDLIASYGLDQRRVQAVHHGLDEAFHRPAKTGRALVARTRDGQDVPYVLYAATLLPRKNLAAVREGVAALARDGFPHVLAIAGRAPADRPQSRELEREASAEIPGAPGRVAMLGQPSDRDLAALMASADAFCLPSLYEGFGLTALEAMGAGAPVVVSDRGALPEIVGEAGIVVEPTGAAVAGALRRVLSDPSLARALRERGVARAREFTWERTAAGWLEVLLAASRQPYTRPRR